VLNKADQLDTESLMRVYGALLWSMGRIFKGAEVSRIYVGSFRDEPSTREEHKKLFDKDKKVLMNHMEQLPKACSMRKINEMVIKPTYLYDIFVLNPAIISYVCIKPIYYTIFLY
jgi:EH domain-containing protein 1